MNHSRYLFLMLLVCLAVPRIAANEACKSTVTAKSPPPGSFKCPNTEGLQCDLEITTSDLRIGDPVSAKAEKARFFRDQAQRVYTKLYSRVRNVGGMPAPSGKVEIVFSYKTPEMKAKDPWIVIGTYRVVSVTAVFPNQAYVQPDPVCWHAGGNGSLPLKFTLRAEVKWSGSTEKDLTNNVVEKRYDLTRIPAKKAADIGVALDLSGSMDDPLPGGSGPKLAAAKDKAKMFVGLIEPGDRLGIYGFATSNPANKPFSAAYVDTEGKPRSGRWEDPSVIFSPAC